LRAHAISLRSLALVGFFALAGIAVINCSTGVAACDKQCDCEKCATSAYDACVATGASDAQEALTAGCTSELDAVHECITSTGVCTGKDFSTKCDAQKATLKTCLDKKTK
jgi:hypothetical protein